MKFRPTINLNNVTKRQIINGDLDITPGQWLKFGCAKGQFITVRDNTLFVSWTKKNESFHGRTQRFARARWYQAKQMGPDAVSVVISAPDSMGLDRIKKAVSRFPQYV